MVEIGDGWMPIGANPKFPMYTLDRYKAGIERLNQSCDRAGRDPSSVTKAYNAVWPSNAPPFEADEGERFLCTGSSQKIADDINGLAEVGVEHLLLNFVRPTLEQTLDELDRFAAEVWPLLSI